MFRNRSCYPIVGRFTNPRHCVGTGVPDGPSQIRSIDKTAESTMTRTNIFLYFILPTSQQKVKKKRPGAHDSETPCRSIQYVKKKNQAEAWFSVFALPIFTGSDASAACGRYSELSEWQRSKFREPSANKKFRAPQQDPSPGNYRRRTCV